VPRQGKKGTHDRQGEAAKMGEGLRMSGTGQVSEDIKDSGSQATHHWRRELYTPKRGDNR
jgi:hypothetical protein